MDPITGSLIFAGGSSILGGIGNWLNGKENRKAQQRANTQNYNAQKEFYQNSVRWRVADSRAAGVNPLYGLGADSASFSPSFQAVANTGAGDALNSVSQAGLAMSQIMAQSQMMRAQTRMYNAEAALKEKQTIELGSTSSNSNVLDPTKSDPSASVSPSTPKNKKKVLPQNDYGVGFVPGSNKTMVYDYTDESKDRIVVSPIGSQVREEFFQGISKTPVGQFVDKLQAKFGFRFKNKIVLPSGTYFLAIGDTDPNGLVYHRAKPEPSKQVVIEGGRIYFK